MTKAIRIENADGSDYKVEVQTWEKSGNNEPDKLIKTEYLNYPTAMTEYNNTYITSTRYLVVKEVVDSEI